MKTKKPPQPKRPTRPRGIVGKFEEGNSIGFIATTRCHRIDHRGAGGYLPRLGACVSCRKHVESAIRRELKRLRARGK